MDKHQTTKTTSDDVLKSFALEPMSQANITNLQQVNEDCLRKIFSVDSLDPIDLCPIAETCRLFRQIAQRMAPDYIALESNYDSSEYYLEFKRNSRRSQNDIDTIFRIFGSSLATVEIKGPYQGPYNTFEDNFLLNLITKYCDQDNLKSLSITRINVSHVLTAKLKPIFQQLQKLHLCQLSVHARIFGHLDSLVDLSLCAVQNCDEILQSVFPSLERFKYEEVIKNQNLSTFLSRHKKLKELHVDVRGSATYGNTILKIINNSCTELKVLHLLVAVDSFHQPLHTFKSQRSQLTELEINRGKSSIDLVGIIRRLTNLEVLEIECLIMLDLRTFSEIVSTVKGRPNVLIIKCPCPYFDDNCDPDQRVKLLRSL